MATLAKSWSAVTQIEGTGDGYTTLSGTTEEYSASVDLVTSGYDGSHVMVNIDYDDSQEDDEVKVKVYGSLDGTNWDDTPLYQIQGDRTIGLQQISFIVRDLAYFRLGFQQTGASDSHDVQAYVRNWNYGSTT